MYEYIMYICISRSAISDMGWILIEASSNYYNMICDDKQ